MTDIDIKALLVGLEYKDLDKDEVFVKNSLKARIVEDILLAMKEDGLTQATLAKRLNKSRQYISKILNETANFTLDTIVEIALALDRTISIRIIKQGNNIYSNKLSEYADTRVPEFALTGKLKKNSMAA